MPAPPLSLAAIRQPALLYDADGRIVEANDRAEALAGRSLAGRTLADAIGIFDIRAPDGTPLPAAGMPATRALAGDEAVNIPFLVTAADGRTVHVLATAAPLRDGDRVVGALSIWQDVSPIEAARAGAAAAARMLQVQERELRQQREEIEAIYDTAPIGLCVLDTDLRYTRLNRRFAEIDGVPVEEHLGRTPSEVVPEIGGQVEAAMRTVLKTGTPLIDLEVSGTTPAAPGVLRYWSERGTPLRDGSGALVGIGISVQEITEQRRAVAALRESEENYRSLVDLSPDGIIVHRRGELLYANPAAARMLRAEADALVGASILDHVHPEDRASVENRIGSVLELGTTASLEEFRLLVDGTVVHAEAAGGPVLWEGAPAVQVIFRDITEPKRAGKALRDSEERLRLAQESANVAVWDWDLRTGVFTSTPEFFRLYGLADCRAIPYDRWRECVHPDDVERVENESRAALARGEQFDLEHRIVRPSGEVRWIAAIGRGVCDEQGELVRVLGVNIDITDRKEAEFSFGRSADELARSNKELQRFAYVASHDLQEPLRSIISFSQLLERRYRGKLDQDADEYIAFIVEGGMRMQALIRDLLQLSRIETQAKPPVPTDTNAIAADVVRAFAQTAGDLAAAVTVGPLPRVMVDPPQLEQVLTNLVANAAKYRRPEVPLAIAISARRLNGMWEFAVADNGIGIEEEYYDRIFEMFQRLHTKEQYEGTGIGLAVVKKIVERHGGAVRVESTPGEGSTFYFTLPAA